MTKKEVAEKFKVVYRTLYNWENKGAPAHRLDDIYRIVTKQARAMQNPIQGTKSTIMERLMKPDGFNHIMNQCWPGLF